MKSYYWLSIGCLVSSLVLAETNVEVPSDENYPDEELSIEENSEVKPHFFVRGGLGMSNLHYKGADYIWPLQGSSKKQFASFVGLGYQFTDHWVLEADYFYAGRPKFRDETTKTSHKMTQLGAGLTLNWVLPLKWGISVMGRYGWTWVHREKLPVINRKATDRIVPVYGAGISFALLPELTLDFLFTKTITSGNLQTFEYYTCGLTYHLPF